MAPRILIMAGGTGGHVFPALAVAEELRARGAEVWWMGTRRGLEAELVPRAGIPIDWISISGWRGKAWFAGIFAPFRLITAMGQALAILLHRRPMVVLGMGGFVTGPGGLVTWLLRKPLVIHEQNAIAGLTNRLLAPLADGVLEAFPGTFDQSKLFQRSLSPQERAGVRASGHANTRKVLYCGNPVRASIAALPAPSTRFAGRRGPLHLLVLGGSLGARALNEVVPAALAALGVEQRPEVWHQAGKSHIDDAREHYHRAGVRARVEPFIDDMAAAYAWADLVLCRAGALTIAELAAAGVGAILVPYPHAVDDHQTRNAAFLAEAGAAVVIQQPQLTRERLLELLNSYTAGEGRNKLLQMAQAARRLAKIDAAQQVASRCLEAAHG